MHNILIGKYAPRQSETCSITVFDWLKNPIYWLMLKRKKIKKIIKSGF